MLQLTIPGGGVRCHVRSSNFRLAACLNMTDSSCPFPSDPSRPSGARATLCLEWPDRDSFTSCTVQAFSEISPAPATVPVDREPHLRAGRVHTKAQLSSTTSTRKRSRELYPNWQIPVRHVENQSVTGNGSLALQLEDANFHTPSVVVGELFSSTHGTWTEPRSYH